MLPDYCGTLLPQSNFTRNAQIKRSGCNAKSPEYTAHGLQGIAKVRYCF